VTWSASSPSSSRAVPSGSAPTGSLALVSSRSSRLRRTSPYCSCTRRASRRAGLPIWGWNSCSPAHFLGIRTGHGQPSLVSGEQNGTDPQRHDGQLPLVGGHYLTGTSCTKCDAEHPAREKSAHEPLVPRPAPESRLMADPLDQRRRQGAVESRLPHAHPVADSDNSLRRLTEWA